MRKIVACGLIYLHFISDIVVTKHSCSPPAIILIMETWNILEPIIKIIIIINEKIKVA